MATDVFARLSAMRIEVAETTRALHHESMDEALSTREPVRGRRWAVALVAATLAAVPVAVGAAESALPGDALYALKQAFEPLRQIADDTIVARHRIAELEALIEQNAPPRQIDELVTDAQAALSDVDAPVLEAELDRLLDRIDTERDGAGIQQTPPTTETPTDGAANPPDISPAVPETTAPFIDDRPSSDATLESPATTAPVDDRSTQPPADRSQAPPPPPPPPDEQPPSGDERDTPRDAQD